MTNKQKTIDYVTKQVEDEIRSCLSSDLKRVNISTVHTAIVDMCNKLKEKGVIENAHNVTVDYYDETNEEKIIREVMEEPQKDLSINLTFQLTYPLEYVSVNFVVKK